MSVRSYHVKHRLIDNDNLFHFRNINTKVKFKYYLDEAWKVAEFAVKNIINIFIFHISITIR
jgi:hypothetical protein